MTTEFKNEVEAMNVVWRQGIYKSAPRVKRLQHMFVEECSTHFREELSGSKVFLRVDHMGVVLVVSAHHGFKSVVTNVSSLFVDVVADEGALEQNGGGILENMRKPASC